jgi:hypothetical protein
MHKINWHKTGATCIYTYLPFATVELTRTTQKCCVFVTTVIIIIPHHKFPVTKTTTHTYGTRQRIYTMYHKSRKSILWFKSSSMNMERVTVNFNRCFTELSMYLPRNILRETTQQKQYQLLTALYHYKEHSQLYFKLTTACVRFCAMAPSPVFNWSGSKLSWYVLPL